MHRFEHEATRVPLCLLQGKNEPTCETCYCTKIRGRVFNLQWTIEDQLLIDRL